MANTQLKARQLGTDVSRQNLLVNGGFEQWQRGTGPFTANGVHSTDRWFVNLNGTDALTVSRAAAGNGSPASAYCVSCVYVVGSAGSSSLMQVIRNSDQPITATTFSLSMRVYSTIANATRIGLNDGTQLIYSPFHPGDGTWRTLTATITVSNAATFLTAGIYFIASGTFYADNASLVPGQIAADYVPLNPADDLARCLRYYEVFFPSYGTDFSIGHAYSTTKVLVPLSFTGRKSVTPTLSVLAGAQFQAFDNATWRASVSAAPQWASLSAGAVDITFGAAWFVAGAATAIVAGGAAVVSAESNP